MSQDHPIDPLGPSAKAAWLAIKYEGPLTHSEIMATAHLPKRSTNRAVQELTRVGAVTREPEVDGDARRPVYSLSESAQPE